MVRRCLPLLPLFFVLVSPSAASAQWRVLEKLSGPGPFAGVLVDWKVLHVNKPRVEPAAADEVEHLQQLIAALERQAADLKKDGGRQALAALEQRIEEIRQRVAALQGRTEERHKMRPRGIGGVSPVALVEVGRSEPGVEHETKMSVNLSFSYLRSRDNNLPYVPDRSDAAKQVRMFVIEPGVWAQANPWLQFGLSAGVFWIGGDAFETFTRLSVQPVRVALKPLRFAKRSRQRDDWLRIEWGVLVFPRGFTAADFGAVGDYRERPDVLWKNVNIVVDFETLFHR